LDVRHLVQDRRGLSASQNAGVQAASHAVVAVVDDDCVPDRAWLCVVREEFRRGPEPLLLTGRVLPGPEVGDRTRAVSSRTSTEHREWSTPTMPWDIGTGGNFAVTREAFLQVGGNDEQLGTGSPGRGGNDLELFHRLLAHGVRARYEPRLLVLHERSTVEEYRSRRSSYGFGVGAACGVLAARRDRFVASVLRGWLRLRLSRLREEPSLERLGDELLVLWGTAGGLAYGWRSANRRSPQGAG
jgi:hypothetical protein